MRRFGVAGALLIGSSWFELETPISRSRLAARGHSDCFPAGHTWHKCWEGIVTEPANLLTLTDAVIRNATLTLSKALHYLHSVKLPDLALRMRATGLEFTSSPSRR